MKIDEIQSISSQTVEDASKEAVMIKKWTLMILSPKYVENISSCSLKKTSDQRKLRLLIIYFSILEW